MATKSSIIPTSNICQGCLSVDRKLTAFSDVESAKFFCDILDPLDLINCPISLCWECSSLMRRLIVFKEQIKQAHKSLVKYTLNNTSTLPVLSKLTKTTVRHQQDDTYIHTEATDLHEDLNSNNTTVNNEYNTDVDLSWSNAKAADTDAVEENTVRRSKRTSRKTPKILHNTSDLPVLSKRTKTIVRTDLQNDLPSNNTTVNNENDIDVDLSRSNRQAADTDAVEEKAVRRSKRTSRKTTEILDNSSDLPVLSKLTKTTVRHQQDNTYIYTEVTEELQEDVNDLQEDLPSNNTTVNNENKIDVDLSWSNTEAADSDAIDEITVRRSKRSGKDGKTDSNPHNVLGKDQMIFVKIEDGGTCDDSDGFDDDDCLLEDGDQELTTELPPEQPKSKAEKLTKVRKKRDKTKEKVKTTVKAKKTEDFDESDEEPLKNKTQKDTEVKVQKKGRRTKKQGLMKSVIIMRPNMSDRSSGFGFGHLRPKKPPSEKAYASARNSAKAEGFAEADSTRPRRPAALGLPPGNVEMVILTWEQVEEERAKARESEAYTRHEFRCERCVVGFNHRAKLSAHMQKHEPSAGSPICTVCAVACRNAHALAAHLRRHRTRWRCVFCSSLWSRAAVAADHAARTHRAPAAVHRCRCGHQESSLGKLRNHMKNHLERQKCELCEKTFRDRASLKSHMFIHSGEKEHACPVCDKKFLFKRTMQLHAITHDASQLLYCHQCDMNFKNRMSFYQHMRYNLKHIDPAKLKHTCPICDKRFAKATRLSEHNLAVHLREAPIRCTEPGCRFACASRPVLRTHTRMAHRGAKDKRNHVCHHCGKAYTTKKCLEGHMRSHTGERPYRCVACDARFGYHAALYNHMRMVHRERKTNRKRSARVAPPESAADSTAAAPPLPDPPGPAGPPAGPITGPPTGPPSQTTELLWNLNLTEACASQPVLRTHTRMAHRGAKDKRNYVCHHCGKAYTTKKCLEGHMRSHTGERPYRCVACDARFGYHAALYNHMRMVHQERRKSTRKRSARLAPPESAVDTTAAGPPLPGPPGPAGPPAGPPSQTPELLWNLNLTEVSHTQGSGVN